MFVRDCTVSQPLQVAFQALVPRLRTHAQISFRSIACPDQKADKVAESVALAWKWFLRLTERGKDVSRFPMAFVVLVVKAVKSGRRLCGQEKAKDVLNSMAQRRHGFKVTPLPSSSRTSLDNLYGRPRGQQIQDVFEERLHDNTVTPVPDQAAFRIDWPTFMSTLSERDRRLAEYLSLGHSAKKAASQFRLSPGRVTQLRQQWCWQWQKLQGQADGVK